MLLFYIRHGQPIYNPDSLTEHGKKQAEALSKRLALYGLDEIYASSSQRAMDTAKPTSKLLNIPVQVLDWCNEGYAWDELTMIDKSDGNLKWLYQNEDIIRRFASPEFEKLGRRWYEHELFSDKNFKSGMERIARCTYDFLGKLGYVHNAETNAYMGGNDNNKRVALFAHEGFGMAFLSTLLDIPYPTFCTRFGLEHSSMTVIRFEGSGQIVPKVLQLSNDSHLYKEGLATKYNDEIDF